MFKLRQPLFQVEDRQGWNDFFQAEEAPPEPIVDEDQPLEESETPHDEVDEQDEQETAEEEQPKEEAEAEQPFNDDTEVDLGEGRQPVKLSELKSGYLRQSDYTKKTQALAEERKAFEAERAEVEPVRGLKNFLDTNPWIEQQFHRFVQEFHQTGAIDFESALQDAVYGQYINTLLAKTNQLEKELESYKGKYSELEFTGSLRDLKSDLKAEYGDLVTDEYMQSLQERAKAENLPNGVLKDIAEAHLAKQKLQEATKQSKTATKDAEAKAFQKLAEKRTSLPSQPRKTGQVPSNRKSVDPHKPMDWSDVFS
ncbi:hypothetical protein MO973_19575 [Paenibacillus sp. TRM 82003]|nr:hypothetical protein [Paenibacillus sp. TRM 82003]